MNADSQLPEYVFEDDMESAAGDTPAPAAVMHVYRSGEPTVVGFAGRDVPDEVCVAAYREQLLGLLAAEECRTLVVDCSGVKMMPSGMLGLLMTLRKRVDTLEIYNPSEDVTDVLRMTNLAQFFVIRELQIDPALDGAVE